MGWTFFFLTAEDKPYIHNEIFNLVYHGGGGFDYESVYNMPIWLRQYNIKKIIDYNEKQNPTKPPQQQSQTSQNNNTILRPAIKPPQK